MYLTLHSFLNNMTDFYGILLIREYLGAHPGRNLERDVWVVEGGGGNVCPFGVL